MSRPAPTHFGLLLFPQWEALDVFGPMEVLNVLSRREDFDHRHDIKLSIIAKSKGPVSTGPTPDDRVHVKGDATNNLRVEQSIIANYSIDNPPKDLDVLIVPGGKGDGSWHEKWDLKTDPRRIEIEYIKHVFPTLQYLFTICSGSGLAARAEGVLDGLKATTNKSCWHVICPLSKQTNWVSHARWVESGFDDSAKVARPGKVWTTSGVSAGIDGFLAWVQAIYGESYVGKNGNTLDYDVKLEMEYGNPGAKVMPGDDPFVAKYNIENVPHNLDIVHDRPDKLVA